MTCTGKHNESVEISDLVCFDPFSHAYRPCLLQAMCFLLMCTTGLGKGRQQTNVDHINTAPAQIDTDAACEVRMCSRELSFEVMLYSVATGQLLSTCTLLASSPGPLREEKGPGTH